ncbi:MAG: hypothetical protein ACWA5R_05470 [bacterium]
MIDDLRFLIDKVKSLSSHFADGVYSNDWENDSIQISLISDALHLLSRNSAFFNYSSAMNFYATNALRKKTLILMHEIGSQSSNERKQIDVSPRVSDVEIARKLIGDLDYSEKIVISCTAFAIHEFDMPLQMASDLMNILFEEAYHLKIVKNLTEFDLSEREWIPEDKLFNWKMIKSCDSAETYMLIEHLLFEGRGGVASAYGCYQAKLNGFVGEDLLALESICKQETNHGIKGLEWFDKLNAGRGLSQRQKNLTLKFVEKECLINDLSDKAVRKNYSLWILWQYIEGSNISTIVDLMKKNVIHCLSVGKPLISANAIQKSTNCIIAYCKNN